MFRRWSRPLLLVLLAIFVGLPTALTAFYFGRIAFYVFKSRQIELEEYCPALASTASGDIILQHRSVPGSEFWRIAFSMPPVPDASAYIFEIMCYDPHHRIVLKGADGHAHQIEICFECRKMRFDSQSVGGIPFVWQRTLRALFKHYGMPERSADEYSKLRHGARSNL
jgi:hypothetical protein